MEDLIKKMFKTIYEFFTSITLIELMIIISIIGIIMAVVIPVIYEYQEKKEYEGKVVKLEVECDKSNGEKFKQTYDNIDPLSLKIKRNIIEFKTDNEEIILQGQCNIRKEYYNK